MRDQLIDYVDLLFAGAEDADDIKQEILQNTLDRYDDLVAQGKFPQAAYSLAISGIGDISVLLAQEIPSAPEVLPTRTTVPSPFKDKKLMRAVAIAMYICCVIPVIALGDFGSGIVGVVLMFLMIAAATVLLIMSDDGKKESAPKEPREKEIKDPRHKAADTIISTLGLCAYFIVSFATGAWYITWLIFPIMAATKQLINAFFDLTEGK